MLNGVALSKLHWNKNDWPIAVKVLLRKISLGRRMGGYDDING
jgi:hypothetical protein